jgi:hypothetical protein
MILGEEVGQRAEDRHHEPHERDDQIALARADALLAAGERLEPEAEAGRDDAGQQEGPHRLAVAHGEGRRKEERRAQVLGQRPHEVQRAADVDADRAHDAPGGRGGHAHGGDHPVRSRP